MTSTSPEPLPQDRPIGYWARRLDAALDALLDSSLSAAGGNRRLWQVLNTLSKGAAGHAEIWTALEPFATTALTPQAAVAHLVADGLVSDVAGELSLTDAGRERHAILAAQVKRDRERVMTGLTLGDYTAAVTTLAQMVANAEAAGSA